MADNSTLPRTWVESDRVIPTRFARPLLRFTQLEASSGVVLLVAAVVALLWANIGIFGDSYDEFWHTEIDLSLGGLIHLQEDLKHVVNDGLMTLFFFVVGLEIKRELVVGDLRDRKAAALPAIAAIGGMLVPALIYFAFNAGTDAAHGWGIPMATDIAFAVGVVALLGSRVPSTAKLFLLALAIADDIGAIAVIAIFYTNDLSFAWLLTGVFLLIVIYGAQRNHVRSSAFYWIVGTVVWFAVFESGVHATLAGVALGLLTPTAPYFRGREYDRMARETLDLYESDDSTTPAREHVEHEALELASVARESVSPLTRLEESLHPWTSFVVIPIFALANAGVVFGEIDLAAAVTGSVALGVSLGLVFGKIFGITLFTWLAIRLGLGVFPRGTGWADVAGLSALAGIGFTVSLFITELAFDDPLLADEAKIGIFIGSFVAGVVGYGLLRMKPETRPG
ncbi:MAG: Na+/H+ antiporter NhaA [Acidimicrobiia bacterium]|nr:Na+/H+ antiporter NhaA [Acidimicrobiia bacterium]NNF09536.1 Na+/H+ antiporter NhaA [Acidimicrobiia bacterium]